jgi:hypothetical protein
LQLSQLVRADRLTAMTRTGMLHSRSAPLYLSSMRAWSARFNYPGERYLLFTVFQSAPPRGANSAVAFRDLGKCRFSRCWRSRAQQLMDTAQNVLSKINESIRTPSSRETPQQ